MSETTTEPAKAVFTYHLRPGTTADLIDQASPHYMRTSCGLEVGGEGQLDLPNGDDTFRGVARGGVGDDVIICGDCLALLIAKDLDEAIIHRSQLARRPFPELDADMPGWGSAYGGPRAALWQVTCPGSPTCQAENGFLGEYPVESLAQGWADHHRCGADERPTLHPPVGHTRDELPAPEPLAQVVTDTVILGAVRAFHTEWGMTDHEELPSTQILWERLDNILKTGGQ